MTTGWVARRRRELEGVGLRALHAQVQGPQAAQRQPRLDGAGDRAEGAAHVDEPVRELHVAGHRDTEQQVGVAGQVLGRAVHHEVGTQLERALQDRRREGAVDGQHRAGRPRALGQGLDVDDPQHRVGRRLGPDQCRPGDGLCRGDRVAEVGLAYGDPAVLLEAAQDPQAAVVGVRAGDDDAAGRHQLEHGRHCGQPGRERGRNPALEGTDRALQHLPGRVAVAPVAHLAARVVRRGHHERGVHRPVRPPRRPARGDRHGGRGQRGLRGVRHGRKYPCPRARR